MKLAATILFFCVVSLLALGMVMLFSASTGQVHAPYLVLQPMWCVVGLIVCLACAAANYQWFKKRPWIPCGLLMAAVGLLVLVLVPGIGARVHGASRWLRLGGFTVQPSELAKVALILVLAWYGDRYQRHMPGLVRGIVLPGLFVAPILGLVFLEPDVGTTVLMAAASGVVLFVAGARLRYLAPLLVLGVAGLSVFIRHDPVRLGRILAFLDPERTKEALGYQTYNSIVAIGSGGLTGLGLGNGRQKLGSIPEHHTDFIGAVIGEELGLVATLLVVAAFVCIGVCGVYIACHAADTFGLLLATGLTFLIGLQALINLGVITGSLPNKGLSLPFISYGGSNLVAMLACVGLLISVARRGGGRAALWGHRMPPWGALNYSHS